MSTYQLIYVVVAAYYGFEVWMGLGGDAVVFTSWLGRKHRTRVARDVGIRVRDAWWLVASAWLPTSRVIVSEPVPVSFDDDGVIGAPSFALPPAAVPDASWRLSWSEIKTVRVEGRAVILNGAHRKNFVSRSLAARTAERIKTLRDAETVARPEAIAAAHEARFDLDALEGLRRDYDRLAWNLRIVSAAMFAYVFIGVPVIWIGEVPIEVWRQLAVYAVLLVAVQSSFFVAHRRLFPNQSWSRWGRVLAMVVSPAEGMTAAHTLGREVGAAFAPLAWASVVSDADRFAALASRTLRGATHRDGAVDVASVRALRSFLESRGLDVSKLEGPPSQEAGCRSYCPRCHEQLTVEVGACGSCPGQRLAAF